MKVLMINHFPLEGSGSGTYTKNLAMQLAKRGHEVCIILPENTASYPEYEGIRLHPVFFTNTDADEPEKIEGALPFNFPCFTTHPVSTTAFSDLNHIQMGDYLGAFRAALEEELDSFEPDIIHGQHVWALPSLAAGYDVPLVLTAHGTDLMGCDKWPDLRHFAETALKGASRVICISADNEALVRTMFPEHADKIVRMRNGYNPDVFFPQELDRAEVLAAHGVDAAGRDLILFAGKMAHFKGVDVLMDAAALYESRLPNAITVLAGGTSMPELATCVVAAFKKKGQLALGNILGSNIFNILLILGCSAIVHPISLAGMNLVDMGAMLLSAVLILTSCFTARKNCIDRFDAALMLLCEVAYMVWLFVKL